MKPRNWLHPHKDIIGSKRLDGLPWMAWEGWRLFRLCGVCAFVCGFKPGRIGLTVFR